MGKSAERILVLAPWDDHPKLDPSSVIWVKLPPMKHTSRHGQKFRLVSWEFCFTECWDCFIMQHCNSRILKGSSFLSNYFVSKLLYSSMLCSLMFTGGVHLIVGNWALLVFGIIFWEDCFMLFFCWFLFDMLQHWSA